MGLKLTKNPHAKAAWGAPGAPDKGALASVLGFEIVR
jgi:hypothetical protein